MVSMFGAWQYVTAKNYLIKMLKDVREHIAYLDDTSPEQSEIREDYLGVQEKLKAALDAMG